MVEIQMPDVVKQHEKTPAWIRVLRDSVDEQGNPIKIPVRRLFTVGTGDDVRVLRWHDVVDRIRDYVENHTLADLKGLYKKITGEDYDGVSTKKGVVKGILQFWFGFDEDTTLAEMQAWFKERVRQEGRWGLGCPAECGRFWEFTPLKDLSGLRPMDDAAITGPQPETVETFIDERTGTTYYLNYYQMDERTEWEDHPPKPYRGYLDWSQQPDGSILLKCDRCGAEIKLVK